MASPSVARVYADVNQNMPRSYWDYDSVNISWGVLENYEVVRKIGAQSSRNHSVLNQKYHLQAGTFANSRGIIQAGESTPRSSKASMLSTTRNASSRS